MKLLSVLVVLLYISATYGKQLPSFVRKCKLADPTINTCIARKVEEFVPHLVEGIPSIRLPKIEPLKIIKLETKAGGINARFLDIQVYGIPNVKASDVAFDFDKGLLNFTLSLSKLRVVSKYELNGKIVVVNIASAGPYEASISDTVARFRFSGKLIEKKQQRFAQFDKMTSNITTGKLEMMFYELFKGNAALTESTNKLLNSEDAGIVSQVKELISQAIHAAVSQPVKDFFNDYAIEELFD